MEQENYQRIIAKLFGTRPVAYNPDLAKALGSAKAGILISQLLYWWDKKTSEWIYKTANEIYEETALSRKEQTTAIKRCKELGVLEVKLKGIPAKKHFKININKIVSLVETRFNKRDKQVLTKVPNLIEQKGKTNSENTTEITTENTTYKEKENIKEKESLEKLKEKLLIDENSKFGSQIAEIIKCFEPINPTVYKLYSSPPQRRAVERMIGKIGFSHLKQIVGFVCRIVGEPYAPQIATPIQLENKMGQLAIFARQLKNKQSQQVPAFVKVEDL